LSRSRSRHLQQQENSFAGAALSVNQRKLLQPPRILYVPSSGSPNSISTGGSNKMKNSTVKLILRGARVFFTEAQQINRQVWQHF
jgi:hypothetical protein